MGLPHLENGQKAAAVALMGTLSLIAIAGLAIADLSMVKMPDGHASQLIVAAFTFFTGTATSSLAYLMGSTAPDQLHPPHGPVLPTAQVPHDK